MNNNHPGELLHPLTYAVSFEVGEKHQHVSWEFTLILHGSAKTYINGTLYNVSRGDLFISKPGDWHYFKIADRKNYEHRDLYLSDQDMKTVCNALSDGLYDKLSSFQNKVPMLHLGEDLTTILDRKLRLLQLANPDNITESDRIVQKSIAVFILGILFENEKNSSYPPWLTHVLTEMNSYKVICGSLENIITLTDFSHEHLTREFKKYVGITPIEYLIRQKMQYASILLSQTDKSVLQISSEIGYDSLSYFISQFKKFFNTTPGQYRKKNKNLT